MSYRPLRCNLILKVKAVEEKTSGGIVLIADYKAKESMAKEEGIVIALGPDVFMDSDPENRSDVKVGDVVAFARYGGKSLGLDENGDDIRVIRDIDLLAVKEE